MEGWLRLPKLLNSLIVDIYPDYSNAFGRHDGRGAKANVAETDEGDSIGRASHTKVQAARGLYC